MTAQTVRELPLQRGGNRLRPRLPLDDLAGSPERLIAFRYPNGVAGIPHDHSGGLPRDPERPAIPREALSGRAASLPGERLGTRHARLHPEHERPRAPAGAPSGRRGLLCEAHSRPAPAHRGGGQAPSRPGRTARPSGRPLRRVLSADSVRGHRGHFGSPHRPHRRIPGGGPSHDWRAARQARRSAGAEPGGGAAARDHRRSDRAEARGAGRRPHHQAHRGRSAAERHGDQGPVHEPLARRPRDDRDEQRDRDRPAP